MLNLQHDEEQFPLNHLLNLIIKAGMKLNAADELITNMRLFADFVNNSSTVKEKFKEFLKENEVDDFIKFPINSSIRFIIHKSLFDKVI